MADSTEPTHTNDAGSDGDTSQMWGGRFAEAPDELVRSYTASLQTDLLISRHDIAGSRAHNTCTYNAFCIGIKKQLGQTFGTVQAEGPATGCPGEGGSLIGGTIPFGVNFRKSGPGYLRVGVGY